MGNLLVELAFQHGQQNLELGRGKARHGLAYPVFRLSGNGNVASAKFDTGSLALKNTAHSIRAKVQLGASGDQVTLQIVALEATFGG